MESQSSKGSLSQSFYEELLVSFLTNEGASKKTQKNYLSDTRDFFHFLQTDKDIKEINREAIEGSTRADVEAYVSFLHSARTASTIVRHISSLRTFFRAVQMAGLKQSNPADEYYLAKQDSTASEPLNFSFLAEWETHRTKAGHTQASVKSDIKHVQEFLYWINKHQNI
jgi:site-specific recombinase XerD